MPYLLKQDWKPRGVSYLEPAALTALCEVERSISVVASAGAGKTEFLAQKADYLLTTGICRPPKRILAISFKSDAARNLADRVRLRSGFELSQRFDSMTFDAFSKGLLDRFSALVPDPYTPSHNYEIVFPKRRDFDDFLARKGYRSLGADKFGEAIARVALPIADRNIGANWKLALAAHWEEYYSDPKTTKLSFAMINRLVDYLLASEPKLLTALRTTYPFVFLDEFQDTTFGQYDLLKKIFQDSPSCLTAVGDNKQRIMVWAGAMPDAFRKFEVDFEATQETLLSNWRSHPDLVEIQHAIALSLEHGIGKPEAKGQKSVEGEHCAIWAYKRKEDECSGIAAWIFNEISSGVMEPEDCAILVPNYADKVEKELEPEFSSRGLNIRNVARNVGSIAIQDVLTEELTLCIMAIIRLGIFQKSPQDWQFMLERLAIIHGVDYTDEIAQERLQANLGKFLSKLRKVLKKAKPGEKSCMAIVAGILKFIGEKELRTQVPSYKRDADFIRVKNGLELLLIESCEGETGWWNVPASFAGVGQVPLMSVHKSKGLEFHTMIFFGLDSNTWWSFKPEDSEAMRVFFVAFTRARQRAFFTSCGARGATIAYIDELVSSAGVQRVAGPNAD